MRWTIALQFDDDAGNAQTAQVLTIEREIEPPCSMLGLLNREANTLLLRLQERFVGQQGAAYSQHIRPCPKCGINRRIKDYRPMQWHAYPSGHSCLEAATSRVLEYLFPRDAAAVRSRAEELAMSRSWARIHSTS